MHEVYRDGGGVVGDGGWLARKRVFLIKRVSRRVHERVGDSERGVGR